MSPVHSATTRYGKPEPLQDRLGVAGQLLERLVRVLRMDDLHHLDLVELVLADHAARVLAVAAGLRAEARRVRGEPDRQRFASRISSRTVLVSVISDVEIR